MLLFMIITIHQPDFLPWLGFFERWDKSDLYVILDDVQFIRRGWHHRDKIKTAQGIRWLTVPVNKKGRYEQLIKEVQIYDTSSWKQNFLNSLRAAYGKAPFFGPIYSEIEKILVGNHRLLIELNLALLHYCAEILDITTPIVFSSKFNENAKGSERLVNLIKAVHGDIYLTGSGSKNYLNEDAFADEGISVVWQDFQHPIYPQLHGGFSEMLSILDFLMMVPNPAECFRYKQIVRN
jgi:hypothetical protein